jgi:hypothetical protein
MTIMLSRSLALLTAVAIVAPALPLPAQSPRAERPTYVVGQKWIRDDGTWELTRIEGDRYIFTANKGREMQLTKDLAIARVRTYNRINLEFAPPPKVDWPLEVGKRWDGWGQMIGPPEEGAAPSRYDLKVEAYDDVKIGARTVKAFRIFMHVESHANPLGDIRWWYSPEVQQIVRIEAREIGHYAHGGTPPSISLRFLGAKVVEVAPTVPVATATAPPAPTAAPPAPVAPQPAPAPPPPAPVVATPAPAAPTQAPPPPPGPPPSPSKAPTPVATTPVPARPPAAAAPTPPRTTTATPATPATPVTPAPLPGTGPVARSQFTFKVTYRVSGSAGSVALTYRNAMGGTEQSRVRVPWEQTFDAQGGTFLYLSVQNAGVDGSVTCEIALDGEVRTRSTSTGAYVIAECSNAAERN